MISQFIIILTFSDDDFVIPPRVMGIAGPKEIPMHVNSEMSLIVSRQTMLIMGLRLRILQI